LALFSFFSSFIVFVLIFQTDKSAPVVSAAKPSASSGGGGGGGGGGGSGSSGGMPSAGRFFIVCTESVVWPFYTDITHFDYRALTFLCFRLVS
jgi:hypothetical protein